ncbi:3-keto-5-aminohexanoate cleavage protein [Streptomonospora sp. S1-112]|uniref:3-keto-5-aminohexanoate cleavage protein n=1 Tax=Streptomonospora mangrovi TaxID=2883123 RepID=A0A9X3NQX8_9ACTN|nr:3-keto-5-aminohexanoate cleavage protein [Streptomonospora mangrovi]MDA0566641.1 3-keto-5-aminohexanoate cleavage protein [Streptomonospora mangrovi]
MRIVACLNGDRRPGAHPALPISFDQLALDARAAVEAGADEVHIHPRDRTGAESLEPQVVTPLLERLRADLPRTPISLTTALSAEPDPWRRYDLVQRWSALPDSATVNLHEPGSVEVARLLIDRQVDVEAGVWTPEAARILVASGLAEEFARVLVEPMQATVQDALANASTIDAVLDRAGLDLPRLLHGTDDTAWPVLDTALAAGRDIRIGLEDTLRDPEGQEAESNAALVTHAATRMSTAA